VSDLTRAGQHTKKLYITNFATQNVQAAVIANPGPGNLVSFDPANGDKILSTTVTGQSPSIVDAGA
jgi:hypothetical protein